METFLMLLQAILPEDLITLIRSTALTPAQETLVVQACVKLLQLVVNNAPAMLQRSTELMAGLAETISSGLSLEDSTEEKPNEQTIALYGYANALGEYAKTVDSVTLEIRELVESYADSQD